MTNERAKNEPHGEALSRRSFLSWFSRAAMLGGLVASYGTLAAFLGRFLYPLRARPTAWMFLADLASLHQGEALSYEAPDGTTVTVARLGETATAEDFIALSSTCPHLGCRVQWEAPNQRFFCPCHNGIFDPSGRATAGPPADAGQSLPRYRLKVAGGVLWIEVPLDLLAAGQDPGRGPGARQMRSQAPPPLRSS